MTKEQPVRYFKVSWDQMHEDMRKLSAKLMELPNIKGIIGVSRGGLVPAAIVARELEIRNLDTVCVVSYDETVQTGEMNVLNPPNIGDGEGFVIVDDLVDSGKTGILLKKMYPKAHLATVYAKPKGKATVDTYVVDVDQDEWILFPWDMEMLPNIPLAKKKGA